MELFVPGLLTSFFCPLCDRACKAGQCSASVKLTGHGTCSERLRFEAERRKSHFGLKIKRHSRTQFNKLEGQQIFDSLLNVDSVPGTGVTLVNRQSLPSKNLYSSQGRN